jgi:hypothetical protein
MAFSITTLNIMALSIMALSIMALSIMALSIMGLFTALSINDNQQNNARHNSIECS